ncbi:MAG: hypothetical protein JRJ12_01705 [Deltaproteobacteria bacterium]|nr:hypothetical protein [Deltaproteobacteria bacterium]MBW2069917.1 hypothetical protein [Deltaproteobacteria bacterium]
MNAAKISLTDLFHQFARVQQELLRLGRRGVDVSISARLELLLQRYPCQQDRTLLGRALVDPYFPLGMVAATYFADVDGMRFYINKDRADLEPHLLAELRQHSEAFVQIRWDIQHRFNSDSITCVPLDGREHPLPAGQWCSLCGICCQIGGVPTEHPEGVNYPEHWQEYLRGEAVVNQQVCPFLFQYFGKPFYFCAIHNIKPLSCRQFDEQACHHRLAERRLHCCKSGQS